MGCEVVLSGIEEQVSRANQHKEQQLGLKQQIESEVNKAGNAINYSSPTWTPGLCTGTGMWMRQTDKIIRTWQVLEPTLLSPIPFILIGCQP